MKWQKWMVGILIGASAWIYGRSTPVLAATQPSTRTKTEQLAPRTCTLTGDPVKLYQITGSTRNVKLQALRPILASQRRNWQRTASTRVTTGKRTVTYLHVHNFKTGVNGWVPAASLRYRSSKVTTTTTKKSPVIKTHAVKRTTLSPTKQRTVKLLPLVGAGKYTKGRITYQPTAGYVQTGGLQNTPETIQRTGGYLDHYSFKSTLYLPVSLAGRSLHDPQSAAFSADNRYLFVMYVDHLQPSNQNQTGWVVRYDWNRLMALGAGKSGQMAMLRRAAVDQQKGQLTKLDRQVLACIKVGPKFNSGHAQSLALNPRTNQLWFFKSYDQEKPNVAERLNQTSLTPDAAVTVKTSDHVGLGPVLTFDDQGTAYYWTHLSQAAGNLPAGAVKLYRGTITTKSAQFNLVPQGLASYPGFFAQSAGYNDSNHRLYLVADESITSLPVNHLGRLTTKMVGESNFVAQREFEGLFFMHHANDGFLLTNRGTEIMRMVD